MPLRNRVSPFGAIVATPERGTMIGNRGVLVNNQQQIVRNYQVKRWICCQLHYKGIRRVVMSPNRWTELFFLDEATALAAGHRPCFECRYPAAKHYQTCWQKSLGGDAKADAMDAVLERDRKRPNGTKNTYRADITTLPNGTFIADGTEAWLVLDGYRYRWSFGGYTEVKPLGTGQVTVLTPKSTVAVLRAGYQVGIHESALALATPST